MSLLHFQGQGKLYKGTVSVDFAAIAAGAIGELEVTLADAVAGDTVILNPPAGGLNAGLVVCDVRVSEAGKIKVRALNPTAGAIDNAAATFEYCLIRA